MASNNAFEEALGNKYSYFFLYFRAEQMGIEAFIDLDIQ